MLALIRNPNHCKNLLSPCVITIGNFDGLHLGHRQIIAAVVAKAKILECIPTVVTFEPLPQKILQPAKPLWRLTTLRQKLALLKAWGIQQVLCLPFNAQLAQLAPEVFIQQYLGPLSIQHLIVGPDFRFGHQQQGDVALLLQTAKDQNFTVQTLSLALQQETKISSTRIRQALLNGDMVQVGAMLGRPYSLQQKVVKGTQRARLMGFPTANLALKAPPLLRGVFICQVILEGQRYAAITNVGTRPTLDGKNYVAETHLFNFTGDLYGKRIVIEFNHKLRDEKQFANIAELQQQIGQDIYNAQHHPLLMNE